MSIQQENSECKNMLGMTQFLNQHWRKDTNNTMSPLEEERRNKTAKPNFCGTDLTGKLKTLHIQPLWSNISFLVIHWPMRIINYQKVELSGFWTVCNTSYLYIIIVVKVVAENWIWNRKDFVEKTVPWKFGCKCLNKTIFKK